MRPLALGCKRHEELEGRRVVVRGIAVLYTHGLIHMAVNTGYVTKVYSRGSRGFWPMLARRGMNLST